MTAQPEALRLAALLDAHQFDEPHAAAAELRRLHAQNEVMRNVANLRMASLTATATQAFTPPHAGYWNLEIGTPEDNEMHCCYCGKKLAQELITEETK
jgi:hypothetical protein